MISFGRAAVAEEAALAALVLGPVGVGGGVEVGGEGRGGLEAVVAGPAGEIGWEKIAEGTKVGQPGVV